MATRSYLTILLETLLTFSLLLPTRTAQFGEATNRLVASSIMSSRLGVALSKSMGSLNSDLESEAARMRELDSFPDKLTNSYTQGRVLREHNFVKDSESVTRGVIHRLDAEARQTSSKQLCEYTVVIQTGNQDGAGTDSDIRLLLSNNIGDQVYFKYLANGHRTFEKGHKDTFVFLDQPCITGICQMVLYTDDYGPFSEWFVVSLTFKAAMLDQETGTKRILQEKGWAINEWLPKEDGSEELYTIRDDCGQHLVN